MDTKHTTAPAPPLSVKDTTHSSNTPALAYSILRKAFTNAMHFIFPPLCIICTGPRAEKNRWFCINCLEKLKKNNAGRDACPRCSQNRAIRPCTCEMVWDHPFERIYSLFDFDETIQSIVHNIKYRGKSRLAFDTALLHAAKIPVEFVETTDVIIPVPLHFFRKMSRGYNQAEFLARGFAHGCSRQMPIYTDILIRKRQTKSQTTLDKEERQSNLKKAFTIPSSKASSLKNKRILLIDDVVTTGATTGYCATALLEAGARSVNVVSLARD
ncbi:MAG: hypothetical protein GF401_00860 [Chitinivibrionales bacterium]|nr:hypothetical protein [Chitinivibrionales bacterium]